MRARTPAAAVVASIGAAALVMALGLTGCGSSHNRAVPTTTPTTPTSRSAPTTTPRPASTTQPAPGPYTWTRESSPILAVGGGPSSTLAAVLPPNGPTPWLIAGTRTGADGSSTATVWASTDANSWQPTSLTGPEVNSQAAAATAWRTGTVVVGSVGASAQRHPAVWISATPDAPFVEMTSAAFGGTDAVMTSVAGGAQGLFVAGSVGGRTAMWYSSNGRRWTSLSDADRVIGAGTDAHIDTLVTTHQAVYAAGWERSGSAIDAALWASGDGINWYPIESAQAFGGPGDHVITALASLGNGVLPLGSGLVAVGGTWTGSSWEPTSWISPNGASWSQPSTGFALGDRPVADSTDATVRAVATIPSTSGATTLVAAGGGPTAQRLWTSTDGLHWSEGTLPSGAAASDQWQATLLAVSGTTMVVADGDPGQPHVLVDHGPAGWQEPSATPAGFGAVQTVARPVGLVASPAGLTLAVDVDAPGQVLGGGTSLTDLFDSADGTDWVPVAAGAAFTGATVEGLAVTPGGLVAVGRVDAAGREWAAAWTNPGDLGWQGPIPLDNPSPAGSDQATGVCSDIDGIAAVGFARTARGDTVARAWSSNDGAHWLPAPVSPSTRAGTDESIAGCTPSGSTATAAGASAPEFDAFGWTASSDTDPGPAYWVSGRGKAWTAQGASPFGASFPFPTIDVVRTGGVWLAAVGDADADGTEPSSSLWWSTNAGSTWQRLDTGGPAWLGFTPARIDRLTMLGPLPVVAGELDGRLAVWVGVPTADQGES